MIKSGDIVLFYWDGAAVAAQMNADFSGSMESRETSVKQSGKATESVPTRYSGTASLTCLFDDQATLGHKEIFDDWKAGAVKPAKLSSEIGGDYEIAANAYVSSYSESYPDQENIEISIDITFTGDITKTEIPVPV